jgi:Glycosyl-4,4'-diaponeurosporenoate acyltransferase
MEQQKALERHIYWHNLIIIALFCSCTLSPALLFFTTGPGEWPYLLALLVIGYWFSRLPLSFYDRIQWSKEAAFYKKLGVHWFKKLATNGDYINRSIRKKFPQHRNVTNYASIEAKWQETYSVEKAHSVLFVFCLLTSVYAWVIGAYMTAIFLGIGNLFLNYYPNLLQQYNRVRYRKVLDEYWGKNKN